MCQLLENCVTTCKLQHGILRCVAIQMSDAQGRQVHIESVGRLGTLYVVDIKSSRRDDLIKPVLVCQGVVTVRVILIVSGLVVVVGVVGVRHRRFMCLDQPEGGRKM